MNPTEIHSVQPSLCTIHTKRLAQKEKPGHADSEHSQIWNFSIFSGMGLDVLEIGVVGGAAGRERSHRLHQHYPLFLPLPWGGQSIFVSGTLS